MSSEHYWSNNNNDENNYIVHQDLKNYVDPWDLENYAYIRGHLNSIDSYPSSIEANSFDDGQHQLREQNYAAIDEIHNNNNNIGKGKKFSENCSRIIGNNFESDEENLYEENMKDNSSFYVSQHIEHRRRHELKNNDDEEERFSLNDEYGQSKAEIYSRLDEINYRETMIPSPIYDDVKSAKNNNIKQPNNFSLTNYGHLKIDYSYSWNNLNKYICNY